MDFLKKGADMLNKNKNSNAQAGGSAAPAQGGSAAPAQGGAAAPAQAQGGAAGGQDYGDKAFGFISKKTGYNLDPSTSEKITDGARGLYEKQTGSKIDPKYSN